MNQPYPVVDYQQHCFPNQEKYIFDGLNKLLTISASIGVNFMELIVLRLNITKLHFEETVL